MLVVRLWNNLLAVVIQNVWQLLGMKKLNTTAYYPPQCDSMVELNSTLKMVLQKHASRFDPQWDEYLFGVLSNKSTNLKPSFLLFGIDIQSLTEVVHLLVQPLTPTDVLDCREQLML